MRGPTASSLQEDVSMNVLKNQESNLEIGTREAGGDLGGCVGSWGS
jgi:hypothetical protein